MSRKRKIWLWIAGIILVVVILVGGFAAYYLILANQLLSRITDTGDTLNRYSVYVRSEDPAQSLEEVKEYTFGIYAGDRRQDETREPGQDLSGQKALAYLEEKLGTAPKTVEYKNLFAAADSLKADGVQAIFLDEAYLSGLTDTEGYEWMKEGIRRVDSVEWEEEQPEELEALEALPRELPESFLVYISGIDTYGSVSARSRSDVNILAAVNTRTEKIRLVATPRDFYLDFAASLGNKDKLTHAGMYGVDQSIDALERLYEIQIDYFVRMNFSGFVDVIDALGGVDVYSDYTFTVENIRTYEKGWNSLTGLEALAFARERYSFSRGDYQRADNQMEVIQAVVKKLASPSILKNYRTVLKALENSIETNMPEKQISDLVKLQLLEQPGWEIESFTTQGSDSRQPTYSMPGRNLYVIIPDEASVEEAKEKLREVNL